MALLSLAVRGRTKEYGKFEDNKEKIIEFCKNNIACFKAQRDMIFCDLSKTATGKIMKLKLREKEWEGRERKVK